MKHVREGHPESFDCHAERSASRPSGGWPLGHLAPFGRNGEGSNENRFFGLRPQNDKKTNNCSKLSSLPILLMCAGLVFGATLGFAASEEFYAANQLYQKKNFAEAISAYENAAKKSSGHGEIYYNLGNAYFRSGKLGMAILNYERARRFMPRDKDLLANLDYANRAVEYEIKDKNNWYTKTIHAILERFTLDECLFVGLAGYLIFIGWFLIELISRKRKLFGKSGFGTFCFALFCFLPFALKYSALGSRNQAVVAEPQVEVRYGPTTSDRLAFRLVEGLKVTVKDTQDDWCRVELSDDQTGWLPKSKVVLI